MSLIMLEFIVYRRVPSWAKGIIKIYIYIF